MRRLGLTLLAIAAIVSLGPRERVVDGWTPLELDGLEAAARWVEGDRPAELRVGEQAEIVWADPASPARTPLSVVYLHGFSADRHEIEPVVTDVAAALDANVYFARLAGHGRDGAAMAEPDARDWLDDTAAAIQVGATIGERVVLIGTSNGGTLATWALTRPEARPSLAAAILISPNYQPRDRTSRVLLWPWGGLVARLVVGSERCFEPAHEGQASHWTYCYPVEALLPLMALAEHVRTADLSAADVPVLVAYSTQDLVVSTEELLRVIGGLDPALVDTLVVDDSGDPGQHVLAGDLMSPGTNAGVTKAVVRFLMERLELELEGPVGDPTGRSRPEGS